MVLESIEEAMETEVEVNHLLWEGVDITVTEKTEDRVITGEGVKMEKIQIKALIGIKGDLINQEMVKAIKEERVRRDKAIKEEKVINVTENQGRGLKNQNENFN